MEEVLLWHILVALAFVAIAVEVFTLGFLAGAFAFGFLAAAGGAYYEVDTSWLYALFAVGSFIGFFIMKPIADRISKDKVVTNADAIVGQQGRVSEAINPASGSGRVNVGGDNWKAEAEEAIESGARVEVVSRDSIVIKVKRV